MFSVTAICQKNNLRIGTSARILALVSVDELQHMCQSPINLLLVPMMTKSIREMYL